MRLLARSLLFVLINAVINSPDQQAFSKELLPANPVQFSADEIKLLNLTLFLDRPQSYVEKNPMEVWFLPWLHRKPLRRGLASEPVEFEGGG